MKTVTLEDLHEHDELQKAIIRGKRIVIVVGAGISTSGGIPDFRGVDGLYKKATNSATDLFDASVAFRTEESARTFFSFMSSLSEKIEAARPTPTHSFLKELDQYGKLVRVYSQNIDYLEERAGLATGVDKKTSKVIPLHGSLQWVTCQLEHCPHTGPFDADIRQAFANGVAPACPNCAEINEVKLIGEKRTGKSGSLRPGIVLYNEPHPQGAVIAEIVVGDVRRRPDLLLIMGTSLKVPGCKQIIKDVGRGVKERDGLVVFVNSTPISTSEWENLIDYHITAKTDEFSELFSKMVAEYEVKKEERKRKRKESEKEKNKKKKEEANQIELLSEPERSEQPSQPRGSDSESQESDDQNTTTDSTNDDPRSLDNSFTSDTVTFSLMTEATSQQTTQEESQALG